MSGLIFGYGWDEIQAMQHGQYQRRLINPHSGKPEATDKDKALLQEIGYEGLLKDRCYGVIDRLRNSGLINGEINMRRTK